MKAFPKEREAYQKGMDLRDYFAAKALQGILSCNILKLNVSNIALATTSYEIADAMMKARKKSN